VYDSFVNIFCVENIAVSSDKNILVLQYHTQHYIKGWKSFINQVQFCIKSKLKQTSADVQARHKKLLYSLALQQDE
jgi:hypothetical protein